MVFPDVLSARCRLTRRWAAEVAILVLVALLAALAAPASAAELKLSFSAAEPAYEEATDTYESIWKKDGGRIGHELESAFRTSLSYEAIDVVIFEGVSNSGGPGDPMYLRASYATEVKQATLVHELAHRYITQVSPGPGCYSDVHEALSVVLAEVWGKLWGSDFVEEQAKVESRRSERYRHAWARALGMSQGARQQEIERVVVGCRRPTMRSSGQRGQAMVFPDIPSARCRLTRR